MYLSHLYEFILLFLPTVNRCSDYACSAHQEKCDPQCHMAVVAGRRVVFTGLRVGLRIRVGIRRFRRGGQLRNLGGFGIAADRTGVFLFALGRLGGFLGHLLITKLIVNTVSKLNCTHN